MKKLVLASLITLGSFSISQSHAGESMYIQPSTERALVKICKAMKSNSRIRLQQAIKQSRLSYKAVAEGLVCNGQDAFTFALLHSADNTANYMAKRANVDISSMLAKR